MNYRKTIHRIARKKGMNMIEVKENGGLSPLTIIKDNIPGSKVSKVIKGLGVTEEMFFLQALSDSENLTDAQRVKIRQIIYQRS